VVLIIFRLDLEILTRLLTVSTVKRKGQGYTVNLEQIELIYSRLPNLVIFNQFWAQSEDGRLSEIVNLTY
jgi:hypothetical protein